MDATLYNDGSAVQAGDFVRCQAPFATATTYGTQAAKHGQRLFRVLSWRDDMLYLRNVETQEFVELHVEFVTLLDRAMLRG